MDGTTKSNTVVKKLNCSGGKDGARVGYLSQEWEHLPGNESERSDIRNVDEVVRFGDVEEERLAGRRIKAVVAGIDCGDRVGAKSQTEGGAKSAEAA